MNANEEKRREEKRLKSRAASVPVLKHKGHKGHKGRKRR
jgi:hypothetical protein